MGFGSGGESTGFSRFPASQLRPRGACQIKSKILKILGKRILTRHPCESSLVFYRRKSPKINKRVHFLTKSAKKCPPPSPPYILCGPGPGRAPPGLPPGGAPVCGFAGSPSTGYYQTGLNRPVKISNAQPARFDNIPWTGTPPTPRRQIWKFPWPVRRVVYSKTELSLYCGTVRC